MVKKQKEKQIINFQYALCKLDYLWKKMHNLVCIINDMPLKMIKYAIN